MIEKLRTFLLNLFTEPEVEFICNEFRLIELQPNEVFINMGTSTEIVGFLADGVVRKVEYGLNGDSIVHYFFQENQFFSEANSYYQNLPAKFSMEAATCCTILYISFEKLDFLAKAIPNVDIFRTKVSEQTLFEITQAQEISKRGNAKERYEEFRNNYPTLANRLTVKDIASFLGTTPNYLSSIRKEFSKQIQ